MKSGLGSANYGFSFGLGEDLIPPVLYLALAICFFIWVMLQKKRYLGWWLIVAGGLANGVSRVVFGYVWDYFRLGSLWFNLADISITLGVILAICSI